MAQTVNGGAGAASEQMKADWEAYFSSTVEGTDTPWANGILTMLPGNQFAVYTANDPLVNTRYLLDRTSIDNPNTLQMMVAMYPGIADEWEHYGILADTGMKAYFEATRA